MMWHSRRISGACSILIVLLIWATPALASPDVWTPKATTSENNTLRAGLSLPVWTTENLTYQNTEPMGTSTIDNNQTDGSPTYAENVLGIGPADNRSDTAANPPTDNSAMIQIDIDGDNNLDNLYFLFVDTNDDNVFDILQISTDNVFDNIVQDNIVYENNEENITTFGSWVDNIRIGPNYRYQIYVDNVENSVAVRTWTWWTGTLSIDVNDDGTSNTVNFCLWDNDSDGRFNVLDISENATYGQNLTDNKVTLENDARVTLGTDPFNFGGYNEFELMGPVNNPADDSPDFRIRSRSWYYGRWPAIDVTGDGTLDNLYIALLDQNSDGVFDTYEASVFDNTFGEGTLSDNVADNQNDERMSTWTDNLHLGPRRIRHEMEAPVKNPQVQTADFSARVRSWYVGTITLHGGNTFNFVLKDDNADGIYDNLVFDDNPLINQVAAGGNDREVYFYSLSDNTPLWSYQTAEYIYSVSISSDGYYVAAGSSDERVYLFSRTSSTFLWSYQTGDIVTEVSISSDGSYVAAGSCDNKVYLFSKDLSTPLWSHQTGYYVDSVAISSDGKYIAAGSCDNKLYLFDNNGNLLWDYKMGNYVESVSISSDGSYIAAGGWDKKVYLFSRSDNIPLWSYQTGDEVWADSVAISSDGSYVAAGSHDHKVYLFSRSDNTPLWSYTTDDSIDSVSISSDGSYIVAGSRDHRVYLFSRASNTLLWSYQTGGVVDDVSISSDGSYIAAGSGDDKVYLFSRSDNTPLWSYKTGDWVHSVSISSNPSYAGDPQYNNYPTSLVRLPRGTRFAYKVVWFNRKPDVVDPTYGAHDLVMRPLDVASPGFSSASPKDIVTANATPTISVNLADLGTGGYLFDIEPGTIIMKVWGQTVSHTFSGGVVSYTPATALSDGEVSVSVEASDYAKNSANTSWSFIVDTAAPSVTLSPALGATKTATGWTLTTTTSGIKISGTVVDLTDVGVRINGELVSVVGGSFSKTVDLAMGTNTFAITATDAAGNTTTRTLSVTRTVVPAVEVPAIPFGQVAFIGALAALVFVSMIFIKMVLVKTHRLF